MRASRCCWTTGGGLLAFVSTPASEAGIDVPMLLGMISIALLTNITPCDIVVSQPRTGVGQSASRVLDMS